MGAIVAVIMLTQATQSIASIIFFFFFFYVIHCEQKWKWRQQLDFAVMTFCRYVRHRSDPVYGAIMNIIFISYF